MSMQSHSILRIWRGHWVSREKLGDAEGMAALYEADAMLAAGNGRIITGRDAIDYRWPSGLTRGGRLEESGHSFWRWVAPRCRQLEAAEAISSKRGSRNLYAEPFADLGINGIHGIISGYIMPQFMRHTVA